MYNELHIGIGMVGYIVYIVSLNWMYIREYTKGGNVIRRGGEWPDENPQE
jgi:hypothetical protein